MLPSVQKKILIIHGVTGQNIIVLLYSANKTTNVILILSLLSLINFQIHVLSSDFLANVIYFLIFPMRSTYPVALLLIEISSRLQTLILMTLAVFVYLCLWTFEAVFEIIRLQEAFASLSLCLAFPSQANGGSLCLDSVSEYVHISVDM
jgi:hypothetical protein